jgi:hypothetical protein
MLTGLAGRVVYAILAGVVAFLVVYIVGAVVMHFDTTIGSLLEQWSPLIGLLVGLVYFFAGPKPTDQPLV